MKIAMIGLGKMGFNLALNLKDNNYDVVVYNRTKSKVDEAVKQGLLGSGSLEEMTSMLGERKVIWLMITAGNIVDDVIDKLVPLLNEHDIIIDGGNSHYEDSVKRFRRLEEIGIDFVDVGTSGGISGARYGACTMIGAKKEVFSYIEPIFKDICVENGYMRTGENGTGHFVKMVHNGIEYAMMQAIGEGFEILKNSDFALNYKDIAQVWCNGSVIRGWLMDLTRSMFEKDKQLDGIKDIIHSSGEGLWTVLEALKLRVPAPAITNSLYKRFESEQEESFSAKVVAALRNEFGGHKVEKK